MVMQSWVNREYRRAENVPLWGSSVEDQQGGVQNPVAQGRVETQVLELNDEFGGYYGVEL